MKLAKAYIKFHSYNIVKPSKILKKRKVIKYWPVILVTISLLVAATTVYALFLEPRDYRTFDSDTSPSSDISVGVAPYSANVSLSENPAFKRVTVSLAGGKYSDKANFPITDLLKYSNQHRASSGLNKLTINQKLSQSAQLKCEDMVMNNYWSHISPNGSEPWIFYEKVGYKYRIAGENLAYGYIRPSTLLEGWMMSPSHRESILSSEYVDVGFGVCETPYYLNRGHFVIVVQHFGTPR